MPKKEFEEGVCKKTTNRRVSFTFQSHHYFGVIFTRHCIAWISDHKLSLERKGSILFLVFFTCNVVNGNVIVMIFSL